MARRFAAGRFGQGSGVTQATNRKAVLFDIDGTLLDTNYLHVLAWWQALRDTGHWVDMASIHRAVGIESSGLVERLLGHKDDDAVEAHSARYAALRDQVAAFPRVADLLRRCTDSGLRIVLASSGGKDDLEWMLPAIGAGEEVHDVVTSSDVEAGKPAPDLFGVAMESYDLDPEATVAVGDTVWDIEAAAKLELPVVALLSGGISEAELRAASPTAVYADPAELLEKFDMSPLGQTSR